MITEVEFGNLKAFKGTHTVRIAPLTLVFGRNSAGKSTIIQALLLLKQTIEGTDPERAAVVIRGSLADLGSFPGILYGHEIGEELTIGIRAPTPTAYRRVLGASTQKAVFAFQWDEDYREVRQTRVDVELGERMVSHTRPRGRRPAHRVTGGRGETTFRIGLKESRRAFVEWALDAFHEEGLRTYLDMTDKVLRQTQSSREAILDRLVADWNFSAGSHGLTPYDPKIELRSGRDEHGMGDFARLLTELWWLGLGGLTRSITEALDHVGYLGPLRQAPERFQILSGAPRRSVGREGQHSAEVLSQDSELLTRVNFWLTHLEIPYALEVERVQEEATHSLGDTVFLVLTDRRTGVRLSTSDVGFGISQLLPIVVQAMGVSNTTTCIEQPEIHVHPRMQANIADLFVDAVTNLGQQFLIETHSEHLMLRLQKLLRLGKITPDQVAIHYVTQNSEGESAVHELRLDPDGEFIDDWPEGFFSERFTEVLPGLLSC